jgi:hypothetical protein
MVQEEHLNLIEDVVVDILNYMNFWILISNDLLHSTLPKWRVSTGSHWGCGGVYSKLYEFLILISNDLLYSTLPKWRVSTGSHWGCGGGYSQWILEL